MADNPDHNSSNDLLRSDRDAPNNLVRNTAQRSTVSDSEDDSDTPPLMIALELLQSRFPRYIDKELTETSHESEVDEIQQQLDRQLNDELENYLVRLEHKSKRQRRRLKELQQSMNTRKVANVSTSSIDTLRPTRRRRVRGRSQQGQKGLHDEGAASSAQMTASKSYNN